MIIKITNVINFINTGRSKLIASFVIDDHYGEEIFIWKFVILENISTSYDIKKGYMYVVYTFKTAFNYKKVCELKQNYEWKYDYNFCRNHKISLLIL